MSRPLGLARPCKGRPYDAGVAVLKRIDRGRDPLNQRFAIDDVHVCPVGVRLISQQRGFSDSLEVLPRSDDEVEPDCVLP